MFRLLNINDTTPPPRGPRPPLLRGKGRGKGRFFKSFGGRAGDGGWFGEKKGEAGDCKFNFLNLTEIKHMFGIFVYFIKFFTVKFRLKLKTIIKIAKNSTIFKFKNFFRGEKGDKKGEL